MKILCISDIHGNTHFLRSVARLAKEQKAGALAVCGDWTTFGSAEEVRRMLCLLQEAGIPVMAVSGNCDSADIEALLASENVSLDGRGKMLGGVGFFGLSASNITPLFTPFERPEPQLAALLQNGYEEIQEAKIKILLSHVPPYGCAVDRILSGVHAGSKAVSEFLSFYPVDLVVCGHIHESKGMDNLGKMLIANVGALAQGYYGIVHLDQEIKVELLRME